MTQPYTPPSYIDVPDPENPPAGAVAINAARLNALSRAAANALETALAAQQAVSSATLTELIQDVVGAMVQNATYDDAKGTLTIGGGTAVVTPPTTGTPTTPTPAASEVYVESFNAQAGTGADDMFALNSAFAAAAGKTVKFAAGKTYRATAQLNVAADNVTIDMNGSRLLSTTETNCALKWTGKNGVLKNGVREGVSTVRGVNYETNVLLIDNADGFKAENVVSKNSAGTGWFITRTDNFTLTNCSVENSRADGFHITGGSSFGKIIDCVATNPGDDAFAVVSYALLTQSDPGMCHHIEFRNPKCKNQSVRGRGFTVVGGEDVVYENFDADGTWGPGIYVAAEPYGDNPTHGVARVQYLGGTIRRAHSTAEIRNGSILIASTREGQTLKDILIQGVTTYDTNPTLPFEFGAYAVAGAFITGLKFQNVRAVNGSKGDLLFTNLPSANIVADVARDSAAGTPSTTTPAQGTVTKTTVRVTGTAIDSRSGKATWEVVPGNDGIALSGAIVCRDGTDSNNAGPWCSTGDPAAGTRTFYNLLPGNRYTFTVQPLASGQPYGPVVAVTVDIPLETLFTESFQQAVGSTWDASKWTTGKNPTTGGGATVVGDGVGQLATGTTGGYNAGADRVARRFNRPDTADFDLTFDVLLKPGEIQAGSFWWRSTDPADPFVGQGYTLFLSDDRVLLAWANNLSNTVLSRATGGLARDVWYRVRVQASGTSHKAKFWNRGSAEPAEWNVGDVTHSGKTTAGMMGVALNGGAAATSQIMQWDNFTLAATTTTPVVVAPTPTDTGFASGLSLDGFDPASTTAGQFYLWRGGTKPIGATSTWSDNDSEATINIWPLTFGPMGGFPGILDIAPGGVYPNKGDTWAAAASGAYDQRFRAGMEHIRDYRRNKPGIGPTYVRPLHEFNISQYPWMLHNATEIAQFKTLWQRWYAIKQDVFPEAKMLWCPNKEASGTTIKSTDAYPGSAYVDAVGVDYYLQFPAVPDKAAWDAQLMGTDANGGPKGLGAWLAFAASVGKNLVIPEYGVNSDFGDQAGGLKAMLDYLEANQGWGAGKIGYANYFNAARENDDYSGRFGLYPYTESPQAAAAYKQWHSAR